jgi:hypothetical protein
LSFSGVFVPSNRLPEEPRSNSSGGAPLQKFEYVSVPLVPHALQEILNNWGDEGWELVQVYQPGDVPGTVALFKRPKD